MKRKWDWILGGAFLTTLAILSNYRDVAYQVNVTFSYKKIAYYYFIFYPLAYFCGGYWLGRLIFMKGRVVFYKKIESVLSIVLFGVLFAYLVGAIMIIAHQNCDILHADFANWLANCLMIIFTKYLLGFSILGIILSMYRVNFSEEEVVEKG